MLYIIYIYIIFSDPKHPISRAQSKRVFQKLDIDGDGRLSIQDFAQLEIMKKNKQKMERNPIPDKMVDINQNYDKKAEEYKRDMSRQYERIQNEGEAFHLNLGAGKYCPCCDPDVCDCIFCCLCWPLMILG